MAAMRTNPHLLNATLLILATVLLTGCGDSAPKKYRVSGEVTWESGNRAGLLNIQTALEKE